MERMKNRYIGDVIMAGEPEEGSYLNNIPAVRHLKEMKHLPLHAPVTFLVGENGTGKSTLLEAIAVAAGFNPEGGTKNFSFATRATHSKLHECIRLARYGFPRDGFFLRAESFYNMATNIDEMDEAGGIGRTGDRKLRWRIPARAEPWGKLFIGGAASVRRQRPVHSG